MGPPAASLDRVWGQTRCAPEGWSCGCSTGCTWHWAAVGGMLAWRPLRLGDNEGPEWLMSAFGDLLFSLLPQCRAAGLPHIEGLTAATLSVLLTWASSCCSTWRWGTSPAVHGGSQRVQCSQTWPLYSGACCSVSSVVGVCVVVPPALAGCPDGFPHTSLSRFDAAALGGWPLGSDSPLGMAPARPCHCHLFAGGWCCSGAQARSTVNICTA